MKKTVDIMDYCNKLFAADLFAGVILEEDFDVGCDYTWTAAGEDWADKFRAELNDYITAGCCAERAADYRKALDILDEMEQTAQPAADVAAMLTADALKLFTCEVQCKALGDDGKQYDAVWCPDCGQIYYTIPAKVKVLGYIPQYKEG